jgi:hypothetical protein
VIVPGANKGFRVQPHATLSELEYVSVLFFDSPVVVAREAPPPGKKKSVSARNKTLQSKDEQGRNKRHAKARTRSRAR